MAAGQCPAVGEPPGLSAASTISFNLPTGRSLSEASEAIDRAMTQLGVPSSVRGSFAGTAQVFQQTMNAQVILILRLSPRSISCWGCYMRAMCIR